MDVATVLTLIGWAIEEEPAVEAAIRKVLAKPAATPQDWIDEATTTRALTFAKLVPNSTLPPETTPPTGS